MAQLSFRINEFFSSIEGETSFTGFPAFFIRFSGCNLRCSYCDTKYAYDEGKNYSLEEIINRVKNSGQRIVHITGGEPLLQKGLFFLIKELHALGYIILLETNGSFDIAPYLLRKVYIMLDIKTPGSGEEASFNFENLKYMRSQDEYKFVITDRKDYEWAKLFIEKLNEAFEDSIINFSPAMPELSPASLAEWIIEDKLDVRFNLQIHKYVWPNMERGV